MQKKDFFCKNNHGRKIGMRVILIIIHFLHTLRLYDDRTDRKNNSERDHFRKFCIFSLILFSFFCNFYNVL